LAVAIAYAKTEVSFSFNRFKLILIMCYITINPWSRLWMWIYRQLETQPYFIGKEVELITL
ncbi:MAG: hypothetical protein RR636_11370, partial [Clostridium sp.]|uniref:hypothetical protein n=1 Tax=Clostridium sp. TaxID=1506 RepID=UPI003051852D